MKESFKEESFSVDAALLENKVKIAVKAIRRSISAGVAGVPTGLF